MGQRTPRWSGCVFGSRSVSADTGTQVLVSGRTARNKAGQDDPAEGERKTYTSLSGPVPGRVSPVPELLRWKQSCTGFKTPNATVVAAGQCHVGTFA